MLSTAAFDSLIINDIGYAKSVMAGPPFSTRSSRPDATPDTIAGMSDGQEPDADFCASCGELTSERKQWMFYNHSLPAREFYCTRCLGRMRIYAWIGFSLLFVIVAALSGAVIWLRG